MTTDQKEGLEVDVSVSWIVAGMMPGSIRASDSEGGGEEKHVWNGKFEKRRKYFKNQVWIKKSKFIKFGQTYLSQK